MAAQLSTKVVRAGTATPGESRDAEERLAARLALPEGAGAPREPDDAAEVREVEAVILGGGICGVGAAVALKREGVDDFLVLERAEHLGGCWHHNTYPGCAVDIPSHLYSFSFALNPDWSRIFAEQPELERYVNRIADDFDIRSHVRFGTEVLDARWEERDQHWELQTNRGRLISRVFIVAAGPLHEPVIPDLPGLSTFRGEMFHSSNWPADFELSGRRVAVIGTGASAIQFVPAIQPEVAKLTIFQRTPPWVMPRLDWRTTRLERWALRQMPFLMHVERWAQWAPLDLLVGVVVRHPRLARLAHPVGRWHIRRAIKDPILRHKVTPNYVMGCKRTLLANSYYPALASPNVEVITSPAAEVRENSIVAADGGEHEVDTIIFGTGFHVLTDHPVAARIRGRRGETLAEYWHGSPRGYLGTVISGFPNMFMMFGPNIGTASGFVMAEAQLDYITGALRAMRERDLASIDVTEQGQRDFTAEVDEALQHSVFLAGGCTSYYIDHAGRVALAWPWTMRAMRRRLACFSLEPYNVRVRGHAPTAEPAETFV
ncbi:NAD(P)/FAD-dependent oxidoreductase [Conexibacter sp. DBS9H8]|uniref:flavin-containing monooxygenase n=1 Tax=Conexibacter sp. DBS9H8 TaxID=2937801 RepID=UPI00200CF7BF|nr:NAD(P)/FAD-dependent oxidoreductase [Conexibacter sp. DBS9H8]